MKFTPCVEVVKLDPRHGNTAKFWQMKDVPSVKSPKMCPNMNDQTYHSLDTFESKIYIELVYITVPTLNKLQFKGLIWQLLN